MKPDMPRSTTRRRRSGPRRQAPLTSVPSAAHELPSELRWHLASLLREPKRPEVRVLVAHPAVDVLGAMLAAWLNGSEGGPTINAAVAPVRTTREALAAAVRYAKPDVVMLVDEWPGRRLGEDVEWLAREPVKVVVVALTDDVSAAVAEIRYGVAAGACSLADAGAAFEDIPSAMASVVRAVAAGATTPVLSPLVAAEAREWGAMRAVA